MDRSAGTLILSYAVDTEIAVAIRWLWVVL